MLTIGHSNRPIEEFLRMLTACGVKLLVDVRKMPYSRKNPQFAGEALAAALADSGIEYVHMPGLGGLRRGLRFPQHRLAKCQFSCLCGLHADS